MLHTRFFMRCYTAVHWTAERNRHGNLMSDVRMTVVFACTAKAWNSGQQDADHGLYVLRFILKWYAMRLGRRCGDRVVS